MSAGPPFEPYVPAERATAELTILPLVVGTLLGVVFGASSLYLVLKVGLTVSASIPVAVLSITLFRLLRRAGLRGATILEHNIVQTAGSAGESIAFGVGVTMPAILILGFDLEVGRVTLVAVLGGLLGILMMVPLRRALIVEQHGVLKYPEGTACAEVLKAGEDEPAGGAEHGKDKTSAATIFVGFGVGLLYKTANVALKAWKEIPTKIFRAPLDAASLSAEISPELLGVGYIIGPAVSSTMCAGGVLAYLVLIPAIKLFGGHLAEPLAPATTLIRDMGPDQIRGAYVLYIGAGAVAAGGIVSLARSLPTIARGVAAGLRDLRASRRGAGEGDRSVPRTERDLSLRFVLVGAFALVGAISLAPSLHVNVVGALLIVILGFLFVTVSSRLTGEIGSSSNPISGMTVATLLITCGVFVLLGMTGRGYYVTALSVGAIVCIAASNGGTTSQDLKTGYLLGATPRAQQIAILVGAFASALALGPILLELNRAATVYVPQTMEVRGEDGPKKVEVFSADLRVDPATLPDAREALVGPQAASDAKSYRVWQKPDDVGGPAGKYLVGDDGHVAWLVDPGINGHWDQRPDGSKVAKFDAPKATLMSYIIQGILSGQLPWGLVLLGVMIALVLELAGIPSLAFAVGLYLPMSSSTPIFVGGAVRWLVDRHTAKKHAHDELTEEELAARSDQSPGVFLSSGYIAGGAIAGIVIAFMAGVLGGTQDRIEQWASRANPFYEGPRADLLSTIPFAVLAVLLWAVGRELLLSSAEKGGKKVDAPAER